MAHSDSFVKRSKIANLQRAQQDIKLSYELGVNDDLAAFASILQYNMGASLFSMHEKM